MLTGRLMLAPALLGLSKQGGRSLLIEFIRVFSLTVLLVFAIGVQSLQNGFVDFDLVLPFFTLLFLSYLLHAIYLLSYEKVTQSKKLQWLFFFFDTSIISYLIYITGNGQPFFLFLYFVHIFLAGFLFQKNGALLLASWISCLYSLVLLATGAESVVVPILLNNFAFFCTAFFSGGVSQYLWEVGQELFQKKADLKIVQDLNESIVENVAGGIMSISAKGEITQCNSEGLRIIGASKERVLGQDVLGILPLPVRFPFQQESDEELPDEIKTEITLQNLEGEEIILDVVTSPMLENQSVTGFVALFQDMTRIRRLESAIRQTEKLAAVGQLAAGIAHEIRNPLASISGSIQLMDSLESGSDERKRLKRIIEREIDRLNNLITEFLDFAKPDQRPTDVVDLSKLVGEVCEMLQLNDQLPKNVQLKRNITESLKIRGNEQHLKQAFLNIAINAYQAFNANSSDNSPAVGISLQVETDVVTLSISDNGVGMDESTRKRIFEPFHTTKAKGTGLGLAVTHKILQNHHANINVKSEKGFGTEFILTFPLVTN